MIWTQRKASRRRWSVYILVGEGSLPATDSSYGPSQLPSIQDILLEEGITMSITIEIQGHPIMAVIDTGAEKICQSWLEKIGMDCSQKPPVRLKGAFIKPPAVKEISHILSYNSYDHQPLLVREVSHILPDIGKSAANNYSDTILPVPEHLIQLYTSPQFSNHSSHRLRWYLLQRWFWSG